MPHVPEPLPSPIALPACAFAAALPDERTEPDWPVLLSLGACALAMFGLSLAGVAAA